MEKITINLYSYDELSDESKETAYNDWLANCPYFPFECEHKESLDKFCEIFDVNVTNYSCDEYYTKIDYDFNVSDDLKNISGIRLYNKLWYLYSDYLYTGKFYYKNNKHRYSKVFVNNCCTLTGVCTDENILEPMYAFMEKFNKDDYDIDFETLIEKCLKSWIKGLQSDFNYYYSKENFEEIATCYDDLKFTEDGSRYIA